MVLLFSEVKEDSNIEIYSIKKYLTKDNIDICAICSGGCTVLSLLTLNKHINIDSVDINKEQIYLTELKYQANNYLNDYYDFLEGKSSNQINNYILIQDKLSDECREYWDNNINLIINGVNNIGVFDLLFQELNRLDYNFDTLFNRQILIKLFGENAVKNSQKVEFSDHFRNVFYRLNKYYTSKNNYFLHKLYSDSSFDKSLLPKYLIDKINPNNKLNYFNINFIDYLENIDKKYDLIIPSNITDWMSNNNIKNFLILCNKKLNNGGIIILRRLNGDYSLNKCIKELPEYKILLNNYLLDSTCFYNEVIVAQKVNQ